MQTTRETWVAEEPETAIRKIKTTFSKLGELKAVVPGQHIDGIVAFGVTPVTVRVSWRAEEAEVPSEKMGRMPMGAATTRPPIPMVGTTLTLQAESADASGKAAQSAIDRFEDAYNHFGSPDYKPDRLGVLPFTIFGIAVALLLLGFAVCQIPAVRKRLPVMPANYLKDQQQKKADALAEKQRREEAGETVEAGK